MSIFEKNPIYFSSNYDSEVLHDDGTGEQIKGAYIPKSCLPFDYKVLKDLISIQDKFDEVGHIFMVISHRLTEIEKVIEKILTPGSDLALMLTDNNEDMRRMGEEVAELKRRLGNI